ncbi:MAG TPA: NAD(P)-dependent alcohol dehydrogenase [Candidatus Limnocylindrales bacterium]|nr:NAD(P)-dependent alcohol dehydrogenase [Candidatus Limnocylindrales bacterium]
MSKPTMLAAVCERYGPPERVELRAVERPEPTEDRILVRLRAASVNRADLDGLKPRPSFARLFTGFRAPKDPRMGLDAAGIVEAVGPAVSRFRPGDAVFGDLFPYAGAGSFAEFACAREKAFLPIPAGMSFEVAATLPHSAVLAVQGLRLRDGRTPQAGDRVLIDGASGNVGPFAVQIAKAMGAEVTGVCSGDKGDFVRSLGADHVVDYRAIDYTASGERYDWILDTDSHHSILRVRRALRRHGAYVTLGGTSVPIVAGMTIGPLVSMASDRWSGLCLWWKPFHAPDVATITGLIADGKLRPAIDRRYPLSDIVAALRWVEDGRARGKVIIEFPD